MSRPLELLVAVLVGWALGTCDGWHDPAPVPVAALRAEISDVAAQCDLAVAVAREDVQRQIDHEEHEQRRRAGDLFCLALLGRQATAPQGYRYASDWAWLNCRRDRW